MVEIMVYLFRSLLTTFVVTYYIWGIMNSMRVSSAYTPLKHRDLVLYSDHPG